MSGELALLDRLLRLSSDPAVRVEDFERCVAASPRLAAEVVRIANSPLHGMEGRIRELQRAVLILGVAPVTAIAAAVLVRRALCTSERGAPGEALWIHSLEVAVCGEEIARCLDLRVGPEAYLVGLLHERRVAGPLAFDAGDLPASLVRAAHAIAQAGPAVSGECPSPDEAALAFAELDLYPEDLASVRAALERRTKQLSELLQAAPRQA
jgi:hypothetical protein